MGFGELVVGDVVPCHVLFAELGEDGGDFGGSVESGEVEGDEDVGGLGRVVAVDEFGDGARVDDGVQREERAGRFGDLDGEQSFAALAELGAFGDEPQAVEVHVRARDDGDEFGVRADQFVLHDVALEAREGERACMIPCWKREDLSVRCCKHRYLWFATTRAAIGSRIFELNGPEVR